MKKILIVDDECYIHDAILFEVEDRAIVLSAYTIEEAWELFTQHPDLDLIVMDACVPGHRPTTLPLVQRMRQTYTKKIISSSSMPEYRELYRGLCDDEAPKVVVPDIVRDFVGSAA